MKVRMVDLAAQNREIEVEVQGELTRLRAESVAIGEDLKRLKDPEKWQDMDPGRLAAFKSLMDSMDESTFAFPYNPLKSWNERTDLDEKVRGFADELFLIACEREKEIDEIIERNAEHWRMDRMAAVDRNLLRAGVAEFLGFPQTPRPVVINESLEIARRYSTPESVQFINGVLDSVARELGEAGKK